MSILSNVKKSLASARFKDLAPYVDRHFYYSQYPDVATAGLDPLLHYMLHGWTEDRDPSPWFSTRGYLKLHPDVAEAGVNPLLHYVRHGRAEGRQLYRSADKPKGAELAPPEFFPPTGVDHVGEMLRYIYFSGEAPHATQHIDIETAARSVIAEKIANKALVISDEDEAVFRHASAIFELFDREFYIANNADAAHSGMEPILHYCKYGWKELRNPNADFDIFWYTREHLDLKYDLIDPLLHYVLVGKNLRLETKDPKPFNISSDGIAYRPDQQIRRICLFAAYDPHGLIDDYVVDYLKELAKFADVYMLTDCELQPGEDAKIAPLVKGCWAFRHGEYDFGSYARLARELVGWETIAAYDELILANDSCYLVHPLNHIFEKMDAKVTDWWGLQATKGLHHDRVAERERHPLPIPMEIVKKDYLNRFKAHNQFDFLLGSYFLVFRKSVIADGAFRAIFDSVTTQSTKLAIIRKYEVGLTYSLIDHGYNFDTYVRDLLPIHPIYSESIFDIIGDGFPLFKRLILSENHYYVADLARWKERLIAVAPNADVDVIERNLLRVSDPEKLHRNLHADRDDNFNPIYQALLTPEEMAFRDAETPTHDNWWAFPACAYDGTFASNERAVFEEVRYNANIKKIILTRSKHIEIDGENVEIYPLHSREGQEALLKSKVIFIKHTPTSNVVYPISSKRHHFINLWHGIPLKRIGYASLDTADTRKRVSQEHEKLTATISSSKVDTLAMAAGFYPQSYDDIWMTGLPRNDFIMRSYGDLPDDLQEEETKLRAMLAGRHLVLLCPTFRNGKNGTGYQFTEEEKTKLYCWLTHRDAVLGIREHMADCHRAYSTQLKHENIVNLSSSIYPNIEILYRVSSCLITDYSSSFIDYILTGNHQISLAYDLDTYREQERGMFYDLDFAFPGDICRTFSEVLSALDASERRGFKNNDPAFEWKKKLFFAYSDAQNSQRVLSHIHDLLGWN